MAKVIQMAPPKEKQASPIVLAMLEKLDAKRCDATIKKWERFQKTLSRSNQQTQAI